jgi:hypothetical protein
MEATVAEGNNKRFHTNATRRTEGVNQTALTFESMAQN